MLAGEHCTRALLDLYAFKRRPATNRTEDRRTRAASPKTTRRMRELNHGRSSTAVRGRVNDLKTAQARISRTRNHRSRAGLTPRHIVRSPGSSEYLTTHDTAIENCQSKAVSKMLLPKYLINTISKPCAADDRPSRQSRKAPRIRQFLRKCLLKVKARC